MSAKREVFLRAMRDRPYAVTIARTMLATVTSASQFATGFAAELRRHAPGDALRAVADLFARHGEAGDVQALRKLANVVAFHELTWREIDGN